MLIRDVLARMRRDRIAVLVLIWIVGMIAFGLFITAAVYFGGPIDQKKGEGFFTVFGSLVGIVGAVVFTISSIGIYSSSDGDSYLRLLRIDQYIRLLDDDVFNDFSNYVADLQSSWLYDREFETYKNSPTVCLKDWLIKYNKDTPERRTKELAAIRNSPQKK